MGHKLIYKGEMLDYYFEPILENANMKRSVCYVKIMLSLMILI